jgi:hypothetical protein
VGTFVSVDLIYAHAENIKLSISFRLASAVPRAPFIEANMALKKTALSLRQPRSWLASTQALAITAGFFYLREGRVN